MPTFIRSALFVPGNRSDRIDKALNSGADAVIIDLEDAVPVHEKESAREIAQQKLSTYNNGQIFIRINSLESPFGLPDLEAVIVKGLKGVILPKVDSTHQLLEINRLITEKERAHGLGLGSILLIPLIETALGVQRIYEIASVKLSPDRLFTVAFGAADYTADMGIKMTKEATELYYPRARLAVACRAADIAPPIDSPFMLHIKDTEAFMEDAMRAKNLGFQGKLLIHPAQIEPCHQVFTPTPDEIAQAKKIITAFEEAEEKGIGAIQVDGKFVDYPVIRRAREVLALAEEIEDRHKKSKI